MPVFLLAIIILATVIVELEGLSSAYCAISPQHTLCEDSNFKQCPHNVEARGVGSFNKKTILKNHNKIRSEIATGYGLLHPASNMMLMEWDDELAEIAQRHADRCVEEHDCQECRRVQRFNVGQNIHYVRVGRYQNDRRPYANWAGIIGAWKSIGAMKVNSSSIQSYRIPEHSPESSFTQIIWANSYLIGCGYVRFYEKWPRYVTNIYVCNYGPGGNILSGEMYKIGFPCSACPFNTSCSFKHPGLCGYGTPLPTPALTVLQGFLRLISGHKYNYTDGTRKLSTQPLEDQALSFHQEAHTMKPLEDQEDLTVHQKVHQMRSLEDQEELVSHQESRQMKPSKDQEDLILHEEAIQIKLLEDQEELILHQDARQMKPSKDQEALILHEEASQMKLLEDQEELILHQDARQMKPSKDQEELILHQEVSQLKPLEDQEDLILHLTARQMNPLVSMANDMLTLLSDVLRNTPIITVGSFDDVRAILLNLPLDVKVHLYNRTADGELKKQDLSSLLPERKVSHDPPTILLYCDLDLYPCGMKPIGANWTAVSENSQRYMQASLGVGEGAQLLYKKPLVEPSNGIICVTTVLRQLAARNRTFTLQKQPMITLDITPENGDGERFQKKLFSPIGYWDMTESTISNINTSSIVGITIAPVTQPTIICISVIKITDGPCCLSALC